MRIDRDILPDCARRILTLIQCFGIFIHRPAKAQDLTHIVDVRFRVQVILVEFYAARHVQDIRNRRAFIGRAFELREIGFNRLLYIHQPVFNHLPIQSRHKRLRDRPANAEVVAFRVFIITLMDERPVTDNDERGCVEFFQCGGEIGFLARNHHCFRQVLNIFGPRLWFADGEVMMQEG